MIVYSQVNSSGIGLDSPVSSPLSQLRIGVCIAFNAYPPFITHIPGLVKKERAGGGTMAVDIRVKQVNSVLFYWRERFESCRYTGRESSG